VEFPQGYLKHTYEHVRAAGGVCIADEVQAGFGRTGTHYWGFETQGVVPDIVTMAKSIGNGAPLAAVVTTPAIAQTLTQRIHFNTFGGNPVSCAIGKAVLEVIDREKLQQASRERGAQLFQGLEKLKAKYPIIGDVRGMGLMVALEHVKDRGTKEPAKEATAQVFERIKELGALVGKGGLNGNIIRITPPMCVTAADIDFLLGVMDVAYGEL
jgi:alanine-glyoxylate transaminase/(R)-3-amino-2-methylpropionate-pyruvate transaminase